MPYRFAGSAAARMLPARFCSSPMRQARSSPARSCMFAEVRASPVSACRASNPEAKMDPIRLWYQSYVDEPNGKVYWDRLRRHLASLVDSGTTVDIKGITPHDNYAHPIVEFRCAREVICNAVKGEREGYDAFVIGHFQDAGLYETRWVVDIPVVSLGEASMLYACQLGQRTGIVTINPRFIPWFHHQIGKYGLEKRVAGVHAMTFEPGQILKAYESEALAAEVVKLFAEQAQPMVAAGCDVLIPGGGIPMWRSWR